jgi:hypothetical protein
MYGLPTKALSAKPKPKIRPNRVGLARAYQNSQHYIRPLTLPEYKNGDESVRLMNAFQRKSNLTLLKINANNTLIKDERIIPLHARKKRREQDCMGKIDHTQFILSNLHRTEHESSLALMDDIGIGKGIKNQVNHDDYDVGDGNLSKASVTSNDHEYNYGNQDEEDDDEYRDDDHCNYDNVDEYDNENNFETEDMVYFAEQLLDNEEGILRGDYYDDNYNNDYDDDDDDDDDDEEGKPDEHQRYNKVTSYSNHFDDHDAKHKEGRNEDKDNIEEEEEIREAVNAYFDDEITDRTCV